ncbi:MAG: hypothetical protein JJU27_04485 [Gammaproteobacteria bacterium]|nr:hypothetical protein [Gammaproteobacteria bacterium]
MNNKKVSNGAGRTPRLVALAVLGALSMPGVAALAAEASAGKRVIDEIVVTAPRLTPIDEMVVTAPRIDPIGDAIAGAIQADVQRATALAGGTATERAARREIRLASLGFRTDRG